MNLTIITLFPEVFAPTVSTSILKRAEDRKLVKFKFLNPRDFAEDARKTVDDKPYGGGPGMVLKVDVISKALSSIKPRPYIILLSASGAKFTQSKAQILSKKKNVALICGHYEGVDARIEDYVDEVLSVGDYVLTGGEIPAMVILDTVVRLIPRVINSKSSTDESFEKNLLEYPQYTRPEIYQKKAVPKILLTGDHKQIAKWRQAEALKRTKKYRPDLLQPKTK